MGGVGLDLPAQIGDVDVDGAFQTVIVVAECALHQAQPRKRTAGLAGQDPQQAELLGGQTNPLAAQARLLQVQVHHQVAGVYFG